MCFSKPKHHPLPSLSALPAMLLAGAAQGTLYSFAEILHIPGTAGAAPQVPTACMGLVLVLGLAIGTTNTIS